MPVAPAARRDSTTGANSTPPAVQTDSSRQNASGAAPGANSFTESQARSRIEGAGFANVTGLHKDNEGVWRGRAMRGGSAADVSLDYQGNVAGR
jgi:putative membrane protein